MTHEETPHWQPIGVLPELASMIDGMLESAEDVSQSLQQAEDRPHIMDEYTVGRVRAVHGTQHKDLWLYEEQLARWSTADPTLAQRQEIDQLTHQLDRLRRVLTCILARTDARKEATIEQVMATSDIALAIEVLTGKLKRCMED